MTLERLRIKFTTNGKNDHVTMFILHLPLAVFSFSVKLGSFSLASKARMILHYSYLCINFSRKHKRENVNLTSPFVVNTSLNLSDIYVC